MELDGYVIARGPEGELTLTRARPPFDWRIVPRVFAGATIALPVALSFVDQGSALMACFFGALLTPFAFLMVASLYGESPTLIEVRRRLVIGELGPNGQRMVRVDERTWPAGEGASVVVGERHHSPKNGPSFKSYSVLFALPDAIVELACGREQRANAQAVAAMFCNALREPPGEAVRVYSRQALDGDAAFVFLGIFAAMLTLGAPCGMSALGLQPTCLLFVLTGFWVWGVSWLASLAMRAEVKSSGPELLRATRSTSRRSN